MKAKSFIPFKTFLMFFFAVYFFGESRAQSNVFDNIISQSPAHTYLTAAINQQNLAGALQDPNASLTVFAPTDQAFEQLALALSTDIAGLLELPNLTDVLLYHVLGSSVPSISLSNGMLLTPLHNSNTIKVSITSNGVYANHAKITTADITADNGVVHVIDAVILPNLTVFDLALNNNFTILSTAVIQQGLIPTLTNPFASFTVLAPTDAAFTSLLDGLGITAEQLLELDNLTDILLYHFFNVEIEAADLSNGLLVQPLNNDNTIKVTVKGNGDIFFNHAQVVLADVTATNGIVHALNNVILPVQTVVDVAINNGFSILTTALIQEELVPTLCNPLSQFTVFAPTNAAFEALAALINTNIQGVLELDELANVLLYHVAPGELQSAQLTNGPITMISGEQAIINVDGGVTINEANVITADVLAFNGVVHVIDRVIIPGTSGIQSFSHDGIVAYPNPAINSIQIDGIKNAQLNFVDLKGAKVLETNYNGNPVDIHNLNSGVYFIYVTHEQKQHVIRLHVK
jgi:transforming growth factor-beta-induced protein